VNRLASELSPYLLQHASNPVDWHPWGEEAFARARLEDRPVFLSIGYATCHWCHVMAHESFEDPAVAAQLNARFVPVKVDREERPDVDRLYMLYVQATTGAGGWPMSVWLTPDLEPFFGGTYFPPDNRGGRPGFAALLGEIARAWRDDRRGVADAARRAAAHLRQLAASPAPSAGGVPGTDVLDRAVAELAASFDRQRGGFGRAPKFPRASELLFLLQEHRRTGSEAPLEMAVRTLRAIASGGIRDHIGGGFHRYAVDPDWRLPHFEKMLYDQAQLVIALLDAADASSDEALAEIAGETLDYVLRDMTGPDGEFYSAEDADSVPPAGAMPAERRASEGAFYLWSAEEVDALLGDRAPLVSEHFGIERQGNAPIDPHGEFAGRNLLHVAMPAEALAARHRLPLGQVRRLLAGAKAAMLAARAARPRPLRDDKVLAAWNGLMIAAFARGARQLGRAAYLDAACRAARFAKARLWNPEARTLFRRWRAGAVSVEGFAEDYACLVWGLIELYEAGGGPEWLDWALDLQHRQDDLFWDRSSGGWFATSGRDRSLIVRMKDGHDGAEPSATSVGVRNLLALAGAQGERRREADIALVFRGSAARLAEAGRSVPMLLAALSEWHGRRRRHVVRAGARRPQGGGRAGI